MNYNRNQVDGDFAVRNNQTIGGDSTTRGDHHVIGDLHVSGAIIGSGVSSKDMGLYATESALKSAVPTPEVGMYAEVGSSFPAMLYRCDTAGTWTSTGESVTFTTPTDVAQQAMKASASALVATETTRAEFAEDTIKSLLSAETKERKASNDEIAQMLRRLSVFMSDHHHHCLDPDWLWRELLLGASLDTEKDILTLMGIQYQLTRYNPTPSRTGAYTWGDLQVTFDYGSAVDAETTSVKPSIVVKQDKIFDMTDGTTETETPEITDYTITFEAVDSADTEKVSTTTGVVTFGVNTDISTAPSVSVKATITANGKTTTKTAIASQKKASAKAYFGSSLDIPTSLDTTDSVTLSNSATALIKTEGKNVKCIWVAIPTESTYKVKSAINDTQDVYTMTPDTTKISGYTLYYFLDTAYILNEDITITFES